MEATNQQYKACYPPRPKPTAGDSVASLDITALRHQLQESRAREASALRACEEAKAEVAALRAELAKLKSNPPVSHNGITQSTRSVVLDTRNQHVSSPRRGWIRLLNCLRTDLGQNDPFSDRLWYAQRADTSRPKISSADRAALAMHQAALLRSLKQSSRQSMGIQIAVKHEYEADGRNARNGRRWRHYWMVQYGFLLLFYARVSHDLDPQSVVHI